MTEEEEGVESRGDVCSEGRVLNSRGSMAYEGSEYVDPGRSSSWGEYRLLSWFEDNRVVAECPGKGTKDWAEAVDALSQVSSLSENRVTTPPS